MLPIKTRCPQCGGDSYTDVIGRVCEVCEMGNLGKLPIGLREMELTPEAAAQLEKIMSEPSTSKIEPKLFGDPEIKEFADSSDDERIKIMWKRIQSSRSNAAKWCEEVIKLRNRNERLLEACREVLNRANLSPWALETLHAAIAEGMGDNDGLKTNSQAS